MKPRRGQSLAEVMIALAIGAVVVGGAAGAIAVGLRQGLEAKMVQSAGAFGQEYLDRVRAASEANWQNVYALNKGVGNTYFIAPSGTQLVFLPGEEGVLETDVKDGFAGYWKFDEGTGSTTYDFSSNGNTGVLTGTSPWVTGYEEKAIFFDGVSTYVNVGTLSQVTGAQGVTIAFWAKTTNTSAVFTPIGSYDGASTGLVIDYNRGASMPDPQKIYFFMRDASGGNLIGYTTNNTNAMDGNWHHIAGVWDLNAKSVAIYIDGVLQATTYPSSPTIGNVMTSFGRSMYLGALNSRGTLARPFQGTIDDMRIYNRVLTASEIARVGSGGRWYARKFYIENTNRDSCGAGNVTTSAITPSCAMQGGPSYIADDPSTQKATAVVSWEGGRKVALSQYLTRSRVRLFAQTDWSGGPGQTGPITVPNNLYDTATNVSTTPPGSLTLQSFAISGQVTSSIFDTGIASGSAFNTILWQGIQPAGTTAQFQIASSNCANGAADAPACTASGWSFMGPDGSAATYYAAAPNTSLPLNLAQHNNKRYVRYKIFFQPNTGHTTSSLVNQVILNWSP